MICYKDKTFCGSDTDNHTCNREITEWERAEAEKLGLPIAFGVFCGGNYTFKAEVNDD